LSKSSNKKIKITNIIVAALFCVGIGFFLAYHFFISPTRSSSVLNPNNISEKIILKDVIIGRIREKHELITLEADLSQRITIDNSWGSLGILKKISNINYLGVGSYTMDLANIKLENIEIKDGKIIVNLPEPKIKYINIDENKTVCQDTENGLLRFGQIKLTPAENQKIIETVTEQMALKMKDPEIYDKAIKSSKEAVKSLINQIVAINSQTKYEVVIEFSKKQ